MKIVVCLTLIAGILPLIATNLLESLGAFAGILWFISGLLFITAGITAYKINKKQKQIQS
uniref:hypothetical protein n=1 Tax=Bacillus pumilus TaxID=1408 RepID=UPI00155D90B8|nr:hypothetical protein [Bacillus pumilus]